MQKIKVERLIELVSDKVIDLENRYSKSFKSMCVPSFKEREAVVSRLLKTAKVDEDLCAVYLGSPYAPNNKVEEFTLYNYLIFDSIVEFKGDGSADIKWVLYGFHSFAELSKYVNGGGNSPSSTFYVLSNGFYKEVQPRYILQNKGKNFYVSSYAYSYPDSRFNYDKRFFELIGLCEKVNTTTGEIEVYIESSLDDVCDILLGQLPLSKDDFKIEEGTFYFDDCIYSYKITNDAANCMCCSELYAPDGSGKIYDCELHDFVEPIDYDCTCGIGWRPEEIERIDKLVKARKEVENTKDI